MINVTRLAHVTLGTSDFAAQEDYYTRVLGLRPLYRSNERMLFSSGIGLPAVELVQGTAAELKRMSFQIGPEVDLADVARVLTSQGVAFEERSDSVPSVEKMLALKDPDGTAIDLFRDCTFAKIGEHTAPFDIIKLGHVAGRVGDIDKTLEFYCRLLGFRISDWLTDARVFLRCNADHHALNFLMDDGPKLHHIAFEVQDWSELKRSMDKMAERSFRLESGPSRHMVGHNISTYHRNSDRVRVEIFTEMDQMKNESLGYFDPRPWHQQLPMYPQKHGIETLRNNWGVGNERETKARK